VSLTRAVLMGPPGRIDSHRPQRSSFRRLHRLEECRLYVSGRARVSLRVKCTTQSRIALPSALGGHRQRRAGAGTPEQKIVVQLPAIPIGPRSKPALASRAGTSVGARQGGIEVPSSSADPTDACPDWLELSRSAGSLPQPRSRPNTATPRTEVAATRRAEPRDLM